MMRRRQLLAAVGLPWLGSARAQDASAVVQQLWARYRQGVETEQEQVRVQLQRGERVELKRLTRAIRFRPDGFVCLVRFAEPQLDRGMSLLIDQQGAQAQMWLRMPSWPAARRIAGDREGKSFGGTDLSFEDNRQLLGEPISDWHYSRLPDGRIEALPKAASAYARRVLSLRADGALTQVDYHEPGGSLLKTQLHEQLSVEAGRWRAGRLRLQMNTAGEARSTVLEVEERRFGMTLSDAWFQSQLQP